MFQKIAAAISQSYAAVNLSARATATFGVHIPGLDVGDTNHAGRGIPPARSQESPPVPVSAKPRKHRTTGLQQDIYEIIKARKQVLLGFICCPSENLRSNGCKLSTYSKRMQFSYFEKSKSLNFD